MIIVSDGCKYHSIKSIVNMKLEEYQRQELQFASKVMLFMAYYSITFIIMDTMLPLELLQILACPICKGVLIQSEDDPSLRCKHCNRDYPVVEDIAILLPTQTDSALRIKCEAQ
jgi:uncharacterized protein YbaR (Trm112 family)